MYALQAVNKKALIAALVIILAAIALYLLNFLNITSLILRQKNIPTIEKGPLTQTSDRDLKDIPLLSTVAKNLEVPWAIAFLPDGGILVTERPGRVRLIDKNGNLQNEPISQISAVEQFGEGGLMGIALHPEFEKNNFVYLYYTYAGDQDNTLNRVSRFTFDKKSLKDETIIVNAIPGNRFHNGGRIKFGSDGFLYITTGDSQDPSLAQDTNSLAGKILRVTENGSPAPDNPFANLIFTYGHRNPQGIAWDSKGRLWETEHGNTATDELNLIEIGQNYGWPTIRGDQTQEGMKSPVIHSGDQTWAPAGAAFLNGSIFFAGLRGQALFEAKIENGKTNLVEHLKGQLGRLREVVVGPDNMLYITTSNRDGRGVPTSDDDKIIRLNPTKL
ncbi:MAG: Quinoprotein glucose dehydrogenase [Candidatus Curtissbacteria bacterium GW2011_GWA1_41_11]|uniref:Quinoprotein glucose dehydrogenase n=1 Tax=Candidatus Curtissbacteria bacterium GW2011_GWA1_41_11 TaxID=1618409 RepID=A0A0G0WRF1_9BACT|nr:MAG: Quinoprotein glucose dehydrogenase [Candidatus Curtissbacteria bacterium GW2011_GWA1_41_11]